MSSAIEMTLFACLEQGADAFAVLDREWRIIHANPSLIALVGRAPEAVPVAATEEKPAAQGNEPAAGGNEPAARGSEPTAREGEPAAIGADAASGASRGGANDLKSSE